MTTNILAAAVALSDRDLLARIDALAGKEREATAELVAHLAVLELRPSLYAAQGYGSLFAYCTEALRLSEDAACNRIAAARACRDFPVILDLLACGSLTLTSVRMLRPHLTPENHETVLARAASGRGEQIEALIAELAPRPDVAASIRKLPVNTMPGPTPEAAAPQATLLDPPQGGCGSMPLSVDASPETSSPAPVADRGDGDVPSAPPPMFHPSPRPVVKALSPQRYRVQFTIGQESHDRLRRVQALLRREIPTGDPGAIFDRALEVLEEQVAKAKLGGAAKTQRRRAGAGSSSRAYESRIRRGADSPVTPSGGDGPRWRAAASRHIPSEVRRAVWRRDAGRCAFVSAGGHRCSERSFLELHHIQPYSMDGPATVGNIALRCRRHNQYEAEVVFTPRMSSIGDGAGQEG